uniref:SET binding protein 1 n=1 Tax=Sparus aurata TaxID=8175 RepID=A0A671UYN4_SPAAU
MEPRDLVGSARPKEAELQGGRVGPNEEDQKGAGGIGLARSDDVINGAISEGEGLEEQGEGLLEEQEFSIKEASFQEGSLKLKIQTTKRTKKPPKNLENYICPPEIKMTIRPPVGEGKGGRQGRAGGGAGAGRGQKDDERGPPRKRVRHYFVSLFFLPAHAPSHTQQTQHTLTQQFQHTHAHQHQINPDWITSSAPSASPANPADSEPARELAGASRSSLLDPTQPFSRTAARSPSPQRSLTPDLQLPVVTDASILNLTSLSRGSISPSPSPKPRANISPIPSPRPSAALSLSPSHSTSSTASSRPTKAKDRWSYLKAKSHASLMSPQRDNRGSPSTLADPPSAFPITPASPLYTNTDSLTVHTPIKRKRGRPKKQPLLTVETIHEGTSTSPPSPLAQESSAGFHRRRKTHALNTLVQMASTPTSANSNNLKLKRGRGYPRPLNKMKLCKMQSILNEILSGSSQNGTLGLKSSSAPVTSAMTAMASTIEARLGKQINVSKRGTIYIGKKRGRKPRAETQGSNPPKATRDKPPLSVSVSSLYESPAVPSTTSSPSSSAPSMRAGHPDATMPSLQPISALPSKPLGRSFLSGGWKLSPPRLLANSPSHLSEGASVKEVTLSPISESHSEETIPSDSGIGTDNNSTSDQTEKGPASRRRCSTLLLHLFNFLELLIIKPVFFHITKSRCERQATAVDNFLSQQEKKQKHHRRKRKCLQSRDHLHFLSELEEVVLKLQQLRVSHRRYTCYPQHPYPSIFRLNFHHYYPVTYDSYSCDSSSYLRRSVDLKAKRRRGRPAKASEPITSKLPFVQGYGYPLAGGNYYAAPYAMPYAPTLSLGYFPPAPPFYLPHHSLGPAPPSPFMRPAVPPPKAFHPSGHSKLQPGAKIRSASGPLQGPSVRGEGLGSLGSGSAGGLAGVRLHKRKHKHKHKHKDEPLLSLRDRQELGGLFSGAKTNARLSMLSDRRDLASQGSSKHLEKQRGSGRGSSMGSSLGMFESDQLSTHSLADSQFHSRQTRQPINSFVSSYSSQSQRTESASDLFLGSREDECGGRSRMTRLAVFGDQGLMSFQTARQEPGQIYYSHSVIYFLQTRRKRPLPVLKELAGSQGFNDWGVPSKRRYKRREVEQIQKDVRRMHSLNLEHVQKILRAKRLQRQAKTGNNVIKRRPGRPRKQPIEESEGDGRTLGMPVLERCDDLPGRQGLRQTQTPEPLEFSNHDSISATIETVVHKARSVPPLPPYPNTYPCTLLPSPFVPSLFSYSLREVTHSCWQLLTPVPLPCSALTPILLPSLVPATQLYLPLSSHLLPIRFYISHCLCSLNLLPVSFISPSLLRPVLSSDIKAIWWIRLS